MGLSALRREPGDLAPSMAARAPPDSHDRLIALDLGSVEDPPRPRIEGVAPVQDPEVLPHQQVAGAPAVAPGEAPVGGVGQHAVEECLAFREVRAARKDRGRWRRRGARR